MSTDQITAFRLEHVLKMKMADQLGIHFDSNSEDQGLRMKFEPLKQAHYTVYKAIMAKGMWFDIIGNA